MRMDFHSIASNLFLVHGKHFILLVDILRFEWNFEIFPRQVTEE